MNWNWIRNLADDIGVPEAEIMETKPLQQVIKQERVQENDSSVTGG